MSQISVKPNKTAEPVQFEVNLPELDESDPEAFVAFAEANWANEEDGKSGLAVICAAARSAFVVSAQSTARGLLAKVGEGENAITIEEAHRTMGEWAPALRRAGKSAVDKASDLWDQMSEEQQAILMQRLGAE